MPGEKPEVLAEFDGIEGLDDLNKISITLGLEELKPLSVDSNHRELGYFNCKYGPSIYETDWVCLNQEWKMYRTRIYMPRGFNENMLVGGDNTCAQATTFMMKDLGREQSSRNSMLNMEVRPSLVGPMDDRRGSMRRSTLTGKRMSIKEL